VTGHDGTLASLKQLYHDAGVLDADTLPTELARTLDEAEEIVGRSMWENVDRVGIDQECPAPDAEARARLVVAIHANALAWRAPVGS
jgi:hypothetical protein